MNEKVLNKIPVVIVCWIIGFVISREMGAGYLIATLVPTLVCGLILWFSHKTKFGRFAFEMDKEAKQ